MVQPLLRLRSLLGSLIRKINYETDCLGALGYGRTNIVYYIEALLCAH